MDIPEEALDAAVDALVASRLGDHKGINGEEFVEAAHAALETAAPYMMAEPGSTMREAMRLAWEQGWANARGNYLALRQGQEIPEWVTLRNPYGD